MSEIKREPGRLRRLLDAALQGTHDHYRCFVPARTGFFSGLLLKAFFSGINLSKTQTTIIGNIPDKAIIVYATKHKGFFEYLFYHTRYSQIGLPVPEIWFDRKVLLWQPLGRIFRIFLANVDHLVRFKSRPHPYRRGYIRDSLISGRAGILSMIDPKSFYQRFVKAKTDPLEHLIEIQAATERPVYIVPQLMFFGKSPERSIPTMADIFFGTEQRPGLLRRLFTLFRKPDNVIVEISTPFNLQSFLDRPENLNQNLENRALNLRKTLLAKINRHRQTIIGPVLKTRDELKESILTNQKLRRFMQAYAEQKGTPIYKVRKKADDYLEEIAAKYSIGVIKLFSIFLHWLFNSIYDGVSIDQDGLNRLKTMSQKGPLVLIPSHKSHIDYLILSYILWQNNMPCPLIAAGKNLSFWPLGPAFRSAGAFFIRRTFKGQMLYSNVFSAYIYKLLEEGFNLEFFIEGGRSRTGKMILPKLGLLSIIIDAYKKGACEDMVIAPVYIGYDRVLEESAYLHELEGGKKNPENIKQIIKARRVLKKRYGRIYIRFHEPISFQSLLDQMDINLETIARSEEAALVRNLGHRVINSINSVSVVTPHAIAAAAMLNSSHKRISQEQLDFAIDTYLNYLLTLGADLADTLMLDSGRAFEQTIEIYAQRKFIERVSLGQDEERESVVFTVGENKRPNLEYYKNNCIAYFVPAAFTALAILEKDAFQFSATDLSETYAFLQDFFKNEFAYDVDRPVDFYVRKNLKIFIDDAILMPHPSIPDFYNLTSIGFRKLKLYTGFLTPYFESYLIVLNYFKKAKKKSVALKDRLKKIESLGNRMYRNEEIERKEALSKVNYKNAVNFFISRGITGSGNVDQIEAYAGALQKLSKYLPS
ncbi:MAG: glycerol-3-phosphate acyltransferase [Desulfobacterales bacterium]|nr:glycerol-3-phosphate acyltransferase [Desulfobacterales bacterium]